MTSDFYNASKKGPDPRKISIEEAVNLGMHEKVIFFDRVAVRHPHLMAVLDELEQHIFPSIGAQVILLVGPSGVGKTRAIVEFEKRVLTRFLPDMQADSGVLPIVVMDAGSSGDKAFSWKNFYTSLQIRLGGQVQSTVSGLRSGVENSLHWRKTKVLVIDEGKHIFGSMSQRALEGHVDSLKSLASMSGVSIILAGSYDLLRVLEMSGQIARRVKLIHFRRYERGIHSDEMSFQMALKRLALNIPAKDVPSFEPHSDQLHECTHGCVGVLKDIFMASLKATFKAGGAWKMEHLINSIPTPAQLDAMIRESDQGEKFLGRMEFESGAWQRVDGLKRSLARAESGAK